MFICLFFFVFLYFINSPSLSPVCLANVTSVWGHGVPVDQPVFAVWVCAGRDCGLLSCPLWHRPWCYPRTRLRVCGLCPGRRQAQVYVYSFDICYLLSRIYFLVIFIFHFFTLFFYVFIFNLLLSDATPSSVISLPFHCIYSHS